MTPDEAWARLGDATDGLPGGWIAATQGPAKVFTMTTAPRSHAEVWVCFYGPPHVFSAAGNFDPAAITRGDPFIVATAVPAGEGQGMADRGGVPGVSPIVVAAGETDLVVAASPAVAQDAVETFVAFISGTAG